VHIGVAADAEVVDAHRVVGELEREIALLTSFSREGSPRAPHGPKAT
ncbi:MAG: hypothetical protein K0S65_2733, partial [Labilithrix sp.]|nr:hypothetical protein [Labilithrix sp.]